MTYPMSQRGGFEIVEIENQVRNVAPGESCMLCVTVRNTTGRAISACAVRFYERGLFGTGAMVSQFANYQGAMRSVNWANDQTMSFYCAYTFTGEAMPESARQCYRLSSSEIMLCMELETNITSASMPDGRDGFSNLRGENGEVLQLLSRRHRPRLTNFEIARVPSDEGVALSFTCTLASGSYEEGITQIPAAQLDEYTMTLRCKQGTDASDFSSGNSMLVPLNMSISELQSGVSGSLTAIQQSFSNGEDYVFQLLVTNGIEHASAYTSIARAFANVHLSGQMTGGVCFGGFSRAELNAPSFECHYPAHFYAGASGSGFDYVHGEVITGARWIDGSMIYRQVLGPVPLQASKTTSLGTIAGFAMPIRLWGFANTGNGWTCMNYMPSDSRYRMELGINNAGSVNVITGSGRAWTNAFAVIEYTKTS